ncbi:hypothetical protein O3M35_004689 [Rhynocoris fuscipes]|uniref:Reverse transcriptase domain-containing protein n=1 Tax=Rhynocoris fuscipes TaxID=488301 RepID=A0AAW1CGG4_9HEMI
MWHSGRTDNKGMEVEEFIVANNLEVINRPGNLETFYNGRTAVNIDVTMCEENKVDEVGNWQVLDYDICSDHRVVKRKIGKKKVGWERFKDRLGVQVEGARGEVDNEIIRLQKRLVKAAGESTGWWTEELEGMKGNLNHIRRVGQREGNEVAREEYRSRYRRLRKEYMRKIRYEKRKSWRGIITEGSKRDLWGLGYKLEMEKLKGKDVVSAVKKGVSFSRSIEETMGILLEETVIRDELEIENENQRHVRRELEERQLELREGSSESIEEWEVLDAIGNFKNGKAPGMDNVTVEMIKQGWEVIGRDVVWIMEECRRLRKFPEVWKVGKIIWLRKPGKRADDPRGYRPICLLPILGKVWERLILGRIENVVRAIEHDRQYGCTKGRSVEDALMRVEEIVMGAREKYVMAIFFDIKGAFDALWWPLLK